MQRYYDIVAAELESRRLKAGLWARALAECGADDSKARARYIRLRADELQREEAERAEAHRADELRKLQAEEDREISQRAAEGPSLKRVVGILLMAFAILAAIAAAISTFRR